MISAILRSRKREEDIQNRRRKNKNMMMKSTVPDAVKNSTSGRG